MGQNSIYIPFKSKSNVLKLHSALKLNMSSFNIMLVYEYFLKISLQGEIRDIVALRKCKYHYNCVFKTVINRNENVP